MGNGLFFGLCGMAASLPATIQFPPSLLVAFRDNFSQPRKIGDSSGFWLSISTWNQHTLHPRQMPWLRIYHQRYDMNFSPRLTSPLYATWSTLLQFFTAKRTLGRTVLDAYWVYQTARSSKFPSITNDETISNFRQAYMHQQASGSYSILRKSITENLAVGIAAFHYSTVDPIMQLYIPHALEALSKETNRIVDQEPLSQVEQARLIRGLYRFQLCCNLFTMANFPESSTLSRNRRTMRILTDYISLLEPWEIEEMKEGHERYQIQGTVMIWAIPQLGLPS
ncbi:uncharacterized protein NECHADRAFT_80355 [Fusarium vanettenii 77-13-4]|uniref:Uncharacterized protein n=1 Tax=Fusarium vanettenii (strain ATCC MYA-4622 / CBS 123669 / FGSC 9596 / NRRL 45880 / 77-13-4) TaxID=660122 RepID=C7YRD7_FUSV7|nr:uncharacterized protein NECHADRAFT_80355 [Fusarium vanettenii 77-13-4]EEU45439.1 hypothetical protein NECHADRAFT_80355 [Fusarium vanettenii 77-13-4]